MSYSSFSWGYPSTSDTTKKSEETVVVEDTTPSESEILDKYNEYVEKHIIDEPEQEIRTNRDALEAAQAGYETFTSVYGELPDVDPTPRPENDAEYTEEEKEALKEQKKVTETTVSKVTVKPAKKKAGRKKKNA